jgi:hypothetical protein
MQTPIDRLIHSLEQITRQLKNLECVFGKAADSRQIPETANAHLIRSSETDGCLLSDLD